MYVCVQFAVRPYIMDLGSVNGTYLNRERIESERFYELLPLVGGVEALAKTAC